MAYHFKSMRAGAGVDGEHLFQPLAGMKIGEAPAGIQNASDTCQMALFADTVASSRRQFCRVDDRAGHWPPQVRLGPAVAALARDRLFLEHGRRVPIRRAGNME